MDIITYIYNKARTLKEKVTAPLPTRGLPGLSFLLLVLTLLCSCSETKNLAEGEKLYVGIKEIAYDRLPKKSVSVDDSTGVITALGNAYNTVENYLTGAKEQGEGGKEQGAGSKEQGARGREQGARSKGQGNESSVPHNEKLDRDAYATAKDEVEGVLAYSPNNSLMGSSYYRQPLAIGLWTYNKFLYSKRRFGKWMFNTFAASPIYITTVNPRVRAQVARNTLRNYGYFRGQTSFDTIPQRNPKKAKVSYQVHPGPLFHVDSIAYLAFPEQADSMIRANMRRTLIHKGDPFSVPNLDEERKRLSKIFRNNGYYYFEKDLLTYQADSSYNDNTVDLTLTTQNYFDDLPDTIREQLFTQFTVRHVVFHTNTIDVADETVPTVSERDNYIFYTTGKRLIRERTLIKQTEIKPGELYSARRVERTYSKLNQLGPIKYVDISFSQVSANELDCHITISRAKIHGVTAEVEGTYSAGDWGVAAGAGYTNRNLFKGAEELSVNARVSYEWRENGGRALEAKGEAGLKFPTNIKLNLGYSYQQRPEEFTRTIANVGLSYNLTSDRNRFKHNFQLIDVSYVYLPSVSDRFRQEFLQPTNILKYSYEDHFIVDWAYIGNYSSQRRSQPYRSYTTLQYSIETAGNFLYAISEIFSLPKNENNSFEIFNIPFAQYVKADFQWTYNQIFDKHSRLVYHAALGVAVPFLNASSIPFEKRYFAGGANSVRGWTMRSLGPGGYKGTGQRIDFNNQAGDIKLDLNLEYRVRLVWALELAAFTDAGNIWTIRQYEAQPNGAFTKNFYKEIAWSYGVGIRLNFEFLILRLDLGVKLYDPSRLYYDQKQWRTAANGLGWKDDMSLHFAIGYPF